MLKGVLLTKLKGHFSHGKGGTFGVLEKVGGGGHCAPLPPPAPPPLIKQVDVLIGR